MTCPKCEALREENAFLKSEIDRIHDISRVSTLREEFSLAPRSAALLNALYQAGGRVLTREFLKEVILENDGERDNLVRVYIQRIREVLGHDALPNVRGSGYRLSPEGLERVAAALSGEALAVGAREAAA